MTLRELKEQIAEVGEEFLDQDVQVLDLNEGVFLELRAFSLEPTKWVWAPTPEKRPILVPGP